MFFGIPLILLPFFIAAIVFAIYAQIKVSSTFKKFSKVPAPSGFTGADVARALLNRNNLSDIPVEAYEGFLSDHYDPRNRILRLSPDVYNGRSIAAFGVAAHETGHAIQHAKNYQPLQLRNYAVPMAGVGSWVAFPLFFAGMLFSGGMSNLLMDIGILLFSVTVAFQLITLPVEFNASSRALVMLEEGGFLRQGEQLNGARKVLSAAAMTYLAATAMAIIQLLRLIILRNERD